jgi:hypothetical protein
VHGIEDKRQITVSVSSTAAGGLLPFQVVFTGLTQRSLPPRNSGRIGCEDVGWHLTSSNNHWSNLTTCQEFVERNFQVRAMDENMKTPLFLDEPAAIEGEHIEKEDEVDTDLSIEVVMQNSLDLV